MSNKNLKTKMNFFFNNIRKKSVTKFSGIMIPSKIFDGLIIPSQVCDGITILLQFCNQFVTDL